MIETAPYFVPENPYADEQQSLNDTLKRTQIFERLCYEVLVENPDGARLYEMLKEQFLLSSGFNVSHPNASQLALYWEGMREVVRGLGVSAIKHQKRMNAHVE